MASSMLIGKLSQLTGVHRETIRLYERLGLLMVAARNSAGHRLFSQEDVERIVLIRRLKAFGFSLKEISSILEVGQTIDSRKLIRSIATDRLKEVERQIGTLIVIRETLELSIRNCAATRSNICPILNEIRNSSECLLKLA